MLTESVGEDRSGSRTYNLWSVYKTRVSETTDYLLYVGWDPIFEYEGKTFAEMDKVEKNKISHRFKALEKLKGWLADST